MSDIIIIKILYCTIIMQLKFTLGLHTWIETSVKNSLWQNHPWRLVYIYIVRPQGSCTYINLKGLIHCIIVLDVKECLRKGSRKCCMIAICTSVESSCSTTCAHARMHAHLLDGACLTQSVHIYNIVKLYSDYNYTFYLIFYNYPEI